MSQGLAVEACGGTVEKYRVSSRERFQVDIRDSRPTIVLWKFLWRLRLRRDSPELPPRLVRLRTRLCRSWLRTILTMMSGLGGKCKKGWLRWTAASLFRMRKWAAG